MKIKCTQQLKAVSQNTKAAFFILLMYYIKISLYLKFYWFLHKFYVCYNKHYTYSRVHFYLSFFLVAVSILIQYITVATNLNST